MITEEKAIEMIIEELRRAEVIHPVWPEDIIHQASTLGEESGEVQQAANNFVYDGGQLDKVITECTHAGAMAIRMLKNIKKESNKFISLASALRAIDSETEYPGNMPDEMWEAIKNDRDAMTEALKITVRLTKENIRNRLINAGCA